MSKMSNKLIPAEKFLLKFWIEDSNEYCLISDEANKNLKFGSKGLFGENLSKDELLSIVKDIISSEVENAFQNGNSSLEYSPYNKDGDIIEKSCSFKLFGPEPSVVLSSKLTILLNAEHFPKEEFEQWLNDKSWNLKFDEKNGLTYTMECSFTKEELIEKFLK